jgi:serine phosphatase RsbU (regulator of sigma subunit)
MDDQDLGSTAFRDAALRSERLRILALLGFIGILVVVTLTRAFVLRTVSIGVSVWTLLLVAGVAAYESWMLRTVDAALRAQRSVPSRFWIASTIVETSTPAVAIAFLASEQFDIAYRPLASPALLVFFVFIILSILRLDRRICFVAGSVAAGGYVLAALYLGWRLPIPGTPAPVTQTAVGLNAITLLVGGLIAGVVAGEIRRHIEAALREAETKRKLEAVEHDLQMARSIQQSLLPNERPQVTGFDIAGWNKPADETGGDYFDWTTLPDGKLVVTLADATGHGIAPALLATACRAYARSSFGAVPGLTAALENINQALGADLPPGRFVTFVAATCGPGGPEVELLSAGHGPNFVYFRSDDRLTTLNAQAVPIGVLPFFRSDAPARLELRSGDLVLLATDGFFEWENDRREPFGIERMGDVIRETRDQPAAAIIAALHESVLRFANGTRQQDDLTAVIIKRL